MRKFFGYIRKLGAEGGAAGEATGGARGWGRRAGGGERAKGGGGESAPLEEDCFLAVGPEHALLEVALVVEAVLDQVAAAVEAGDQGEVGLQDHRRERHVIVDLVLLLLLLGELSEHRIHLFFTPHHVERAEAGGRAVTPRRRRRLPPEAAVAAGCAGAVLSLGLGGLLAAGEAGVLLSLAAAEGLGPRLLHLDESLAEGGGVLREGEGERGGSG